MRRIGDAAREKGKHFRIDAREFGERAKLRFGFWIKFTIDIDKDRDSVSRRKIRMRRQNAFDLRRCLVISMQRQKSTRADDANNRRQWIELLRVLDPAQRWSALSN